MEMCPRCGRSFEGFDWHPCSRGILEHWYYKTTGEIHCRYVTWYQNESLETH